jgi:carboxyl-terminal processing protease
MNNMWQRIGLGIICLLLETVNVSAYEFRRVEELFSEINDKYAQIVDFNDVFQESCDLVQHYDSALKFYHNHTKAFLYQTNELVATISVPQNNDIMAWQDFVTTLLKESVKHSDKIASSAINLENAVLKNTLRKLDSYSRLENSVFSVADVDYRIQDNILYVRCDSFANGTSKLIKNVIEQYPFVKGFILDLRENQGGDFNEAIKTADLFLDDVLIAYRKDKNSSPQFYNANSGDILAEKPIVVLTGSHTASAAEIVTAALHEQGRATLIGVQTYGKGSIQQVEKFFNQKLYLTSGYFFSPSGNAIHHIGIKPDICTEEASDREKTELSLAMKFIKQRIGKI